jgi:Asp-tRNA(Asn)/Glu-tRNA(Gln) amidotransferase A subunit family amidase
VKKLRIGYLVDGFAEARIDDWKRNDAKALDDLRALGFVVAPFKLPDMPMRSLVETFGVERGAAFDTFVRQHGNQRLVASAKGRGFQRSYLVPAVDYLQAMRLRGMLVRQMADATAPFDVYIAPYIDVRNMRPGASTPSGAIYDNFNTANLCGYPCIGVPNGFTASGTPTSITFIGRPYAEREMLLVAKAYQDATAWHLQHPPL